MQIEARPATEADIAILCALAEAGIAELAPLRGGDIWSRLEARTAPFEADFAAAVADPDRLVLVGTIDQIVVGYAAADEVELHDGEHLCDLTDIFVLSEARGVGVGEELLKLAIDWCGSRGIVGIDSTTLPGDRATKNFFETFGLVARSLTVHRRLQQ